MIKIMWPWVILAGAGLLECCGALVHFSSTVVKSMILEAISGLGCSAAYYQVAGWPDAPGAS